MARKANIIKNVPERYSCLEHDGGYIMYDKETRGKRSNSLFKGKFFISTDGSKFAFNDKYYATFDELLQAMNEWAETLPFDADIYNPIYKKNYMVECAVHDYLESLGFTMSWGHLEEFYDIKDPYGKTICSFTLKVEEDTTRGTLTHLLGADRWVESVFTDLETAIGACNSMIAAYCGVLQGKLLILLNALTASRVTNMVDKKFVMSTMSVYSEDATQKTIKWMEEELERLKKA